MSGEELAQRREDVAPPVRVDQVDAAARLAVGQLQLRGGADVDVGSD
jgi:hypothetical protein